MQINGEAYFFINVWMNYLSLYLAGALCRLRIKKGRCLASAVLGGCYALLFWEFSFFRLPPVFCCVSFLMAALTFRRHFLRPLPIVFAAAFLLSGFSRFLMENSVSCLWILFLAAAAALHLSRRFRQGNFRPQGNLKLWIFYRERQICLPAFRDSGNLLSDPLTALPVIVAPYALLAPLLPENIQPQDLSTMPAGFHLIPIQTAGGEKTLMAFHPDHLQLRQGASLHPLDAIIALSNFAEKRALLPEAIFHQEENQYASL